MIVFSIYIYFSLSLSILSPILPPNFWSTPTISCLTPGLLRGTRLCGLGFRLGNRGNHWERTGNQGIRGRIHGVCCFDLFVKFVFLFFFVMVNLKWGMLSEIVLESEPSEGEHPRALAGHTLGWGFYEQN